MVPYLGDYNTTETVIIPFNAFTSDDPSASATITNLVAGDVEIHKDGGTTQRSSDSGVSVSIDFDSVTGNHLISIDLSDDTDSGFYSAGSRYQVRIEGATVDGGTINAWIGSFSIGCTLRPSINGRTLDIQATGEVDANITMLGGSSQSAADIKDFVDTGYDPSTHKVQGVVLVDTTTTNTDMRGTENAALATVCTETRLAELDAVNIPANLSSISGLISALNNFDPANDTVNIGKVLGSSLTESSAGYLAAAISYFYNVVTPAKTINDCGVSGSGLSAADVWSYTTRVLTANTNLNDISIAEVNAACDTALTDYGANTTTPPTVSQIADAVWDEAISGHTTASTFGSKNQKAVPSEIIEDYQGSSTGGDATAANQATIIGHLTAIKGATFSEVTDSLESIRDRGDIAWITGGGAAPTVEQIRTEIDSNSTKLATIVADTNELQTNQSNWLTADISGLAASIASILADTNELQTNQDNWLTADLSTIATNINTLLTRLSSTRAGYLDKLNVSGTLANSDAANTYKADISSLASNIATILTATGTTIPGLINALNDPTASVVADAVLAKVLPDVSAGELDAGQSITLALALRAAFNRFYREVVQTSTTQTVKNDSGTAIATMPCSEISGTSQTKGAA